RQVRRLRGGAGAGPAGRGQGRGRPDPAARRVERQCKIRHRRSLRPDMRPVGLRSLAEAPGRRRRGRARQSPLGLEPLEEGRRPRGHDLRFMPVTALAFILAAAAMHAAWNLIVKQVGERQIVTWWALVVGSLINLPLLVGASIPARVWPYAIASAAVEAAYFLLLIRAYQNGD